MAGEPRNLRIQSIQALLDGHFSGEVEAIQPIAGGLFSGAYAFRSAGREYVLRINTDVHALESFEKDDYAARHFGSPSLPIPKIVAIGSAGAGIYAISERSPGRLLREASTGERRALLPAVLDTLEAVGRADVWASRGYGYWGSDGDGRFESW